MLRGDALFQGLKIPLNPRRQIGVDDRRGGALVLAELGQNPMRR